MFQRKKMELTFKSGVGITVSFAFSTSLTSLGDVSMALLNPSTEIL
jgi:hypothetical protein